LHTQTQTQPDKISQTVATVCYNWHYLAFSLVVGYNTNQSGRMYKISTK